jgi:hypothetical protein
MLMSQFRKKPVVINAWRYDGSEPLRLQTPEGVTVASPGDWIIIGVAGETYACKDHIFRQTYEPLTQAESSAFLIESNV